MLYVVIFRKLVSSKGGAAFRLGPDCGRYSKVLICPAFICIKLIRYASVALLLIPEFKQRLVIIWYIQGYKFDMHCDCTLSMERIRWYLKGVLRHFLKNLFQATSAKLSSRLRG